VMSGAMAAPGGASRLPSSGIAEPLVPAQYYQQERPYYGGPPPQHYGRPPPRRQVCWNEYRRVYAGRDAWGRPFYRTVPRRVCRWR
ncbi:MAG TPA: hypothetical protein VN329_04760, partial [Roseomonas sp.]|nr:hypothetical protein [Roseomonas sp.]